MKGVTLRPLVEIPDARRYDSPELLTSSRAHAVNPLRSGPVRINLYNYYDAHRELICVYRVAAPLEGSPIGRKLVYFFVVPPRGAPHRLTFETPGYYRWNTLYMCVRHHMRPAPPRLSYVDPFSGPVDPHTCARYPRKRGGRNRRGFVPLLASKLVLN